MKNIILAIFMFLFCGNAWGTITTIGNADMPYTVSTGAGADDTIQFSENIVWAGAAYNVVGITVPDAADSITIDFSTFNYTFGNNTNDSQIYGIQLNTADYVHITGTGTITGGWDYDHFAWRTRMIHVNNCLGTRIDSIDVQPTGYAGIDVNDYTEGNHGIYFSGSRQFMNSVVHITARHLSNGFYWRQYYPLAIILFDRAGNGIDNSLITDTATMYHGRVDSSNLIGAEHTGIFFYGSEGLSIENYKGMWWARDDTIKMNIRGVNTWSESGFRYGDAYAVTARNVAGVWFERLHIWSDTTAIVDVNGDTMFGGQGIFLDGANPDSIAGWFNRIRNNTIYTSTGDQGGGHSTGIHTRRMRKLYLDSNFISVASDSNGGGNSMPWRTDESNGMWLGFNGNEDLEQDSVYARWNEIHSTNDPGGSNSYNFRFRGKGEQWYWETRGNDLNVTENGTGNVANFFYMGDDSANAINSYSDSITSNEFTYAWYPFSSWYGLLEKIYDLRFATGTGEDTAIFTGGGGNKEVFMYKSIQLTVNGNNSLPVSNAVCSLFLSNDTSVGTTNINGIYLDTLNYYYFTSVGGDLENRYDPIIIKVVASGALDSTSISSYILMGISGNRDTTIILAATEGQAVASPTKFQGSNIGGIR